ncbi:MAG: protein translocase subunit SecD [Planctomycetota bacterium]
MSGRATKWILLVLLPVLVALYASYPPSAVTVRKARVEKKVAETADEAERHGVEVGESYVADRQVIKDRWLPLVLGDEETETRLVERRPDGTVVEEQVTTVPGRIKLGLDVAGGTELLYELKPEKGEEISGKVANTIKILKQRIDPSNVKEYRIQDQGQDRILIQVPAATTAEVEQLKRRLTRMGKLQFKVAAPRPEQQQTPQAKFTRLYDQAEEGRVPEGYVKMHREDDPQDEYWLVEQGEAPITGEYLASVQPGQDQQGFPAVRFTWNAVGAHRFGNITERNRGKALAIVLDGVLKSAPIIRTRIGASGIIEGRFTQQEVNDMVNILRAGSLPIDIELLQENTVGPQLGRDSIRKGLLSLAIAGVLVLTFIGLYYIGCGWVADGALIMNLVLLVGILSILGAALTLPGMAGILLTVGMAVDANVLIFERIREESESGKSVRLALRNGYDRAFTTIVDANVTTLLTAVVLYLVGTGPVRGFAVTLSFGILLSMFTALVVTRLAFETFVDEGWMERFRMFSLFETPDIGFSRIRRSAYVLSLVVVVAGLLAFVGRGSRLLDIDFTGGTLAQLSLTEPTTTEEVRERLRGAGIERAEVQGMRGPDAEGRRLTQFGVRMKGAAEEIRRDLLPEVRRKLEAAGLLQEGDTLEVTADRRAISLVADAPIGEMAIRRALAPGGDVYAVPDLGTIVPQEEAAVGRQFAVRFREAGALLDLREMWGNALRALAWAGLQTDEYAIQKVQVDEDAGRLTLTLDRPIQAELLAAELDRRQFPELKVEPPDGGGEAETFVLTGEPESARRFATELPEGSRLQGVPRATIDGRTITATLTKDFSEPDIRALFEKQGLPDIYVVPLDAESGAWRLNLGMESVRDRLQSAFADLSRRTGGVAFREPRPQEDGTVLLPMELPEPMALSTVGQYLDTADLGPYREGIIARQETYRRNVPVSEVNLSVPARKVEEITRRVQTAFNEPQPVQKIVTIGPTVAEELRGYALLAVIFASVIIVLYVAARFHALRFGVAAVIALVHDVAITAGLVAMADWAGVFGDVKIDLATLAAFLTILGYSLNDTIVIFDRIRENMDRMGRHIVSGELVDQSINQTLRRTVLTSLTTLVVVLVLYLFGGTVLQGLAFTLIIGVVVGTYSSMFIASPVLLDWEELTSGTLGFLRVLFYPVRLPFKLLGMAFGSGR